MAGAVLRPPQLLPAAAVIAIAAPVGLLAGFNPALAILAALALGFVVIAFVNLAAGVALLFLVGFLEQVALAGPLLSFTKLAGALVGLAWLARIASDRDAAARTLFSSHPVASYLLIALVGWIAISIAWADVRPDAIGEFLRFALVAILYVIVFTAAQTKHGLAWIVGGFLFGAAVTAGYGLILRPTPEAAQGGTRLVSTVDDPNVLAATLVAGLILAIAIMFGWRGSPRIRLVAGAAVVLFLVSFLLTGSRGGLVALVVATGAAFVLAGRWRVQVLALAAIAFASAFVYYAAFAPEQVRDRLVAASAGERTALTGRPTIWEVGWRMVEDRPVLGVGIGNFEENTVRYLLEPGSILRTDTIVDTPQVAHNSYLQVLAETGIVGLTLFMAVIVFSLGCMLTAARRFAQLENRGMEMLTRALAIATIAFLVAAFFISEQVNKQLWLLLALGPVFLSLAAREQEGGRPARPGEALEPDLSRSPAAAPRSARR